MKFWPWITANSMCRTPKAAIFWQAVSKLWLNGRQLSVWIPIWIMARLPGKKACIQTKRLSL